RNHPRRSTNGFLPEPARVFRCVPGAAPQDGWPGSRWVERRQLPCRGASPSWLRVRRPRRRTSNHQCKFRASQRCRRATAHIHRAIVPVHPSGTAPISLRPRRPESTMVMPITATTFFARLLPASCRPGRRAPAATQWAKDLDAEAIEETTAGVEGPSAPGRDVQMALVGEQHDTEGENREAEAGPGPDKGVGCFWPNAQSLVSLTRKPTDRKPPAVA